MARHETRNQRIGWFLFILYLLVLMHLMFFSEMEERGLMVKQDYTYNLKPLLEIRRYVFYWKQIGIRGVLLNLVGNVAGFLPFGFILPVISNRARKHWYNTVLCAYLLSYGIEMTQLIFRAGSCDVDDIILNTTGGLLGYLLFTFVQWRRSVHYRRTHRRKGQYDRGKEKTL